MENELSTGQREFLEGLMAGEYVLNREGWDWEELCCEKGYGDVKGCG